MPYAGQVKDPELRGYELALIDIAIAILLAAERTISSAPVDTLPVRLALRVLMPYCRRGDLVSLWQSTGTANPLLRSTGYCATLGGITGELEMRGRWRRPV